MNIFKLAKILGFVLLLLIVGFFVYSNLFGAPQKEAEPERFIISLASDSGAAEQLKSEGFIKNSQIFSWVIGGNENIQKGAYKISKSMNAWEIKRVLQEGPYMKWVVIPEGLRKEEMAEIFAKEYLQLQTQHWAGDQAKARYFILSNLLKHSMNKKIISLTDLYSSEKFILNKLENSDDNFILENLGLLKNGFEVLESSDGIELKKKFRYVNPEIFLGEKIYLLSDLSSNYSSLIKIHIGNESSFKKIKIISLKNEHTRIF